jgi:hypothetical protein
MTDAVKEAREAAIDLATTYAPSEVWSDAEIAGVMDSLIRAVRAETLREVREYLASEEFADALAHVVDDINPRTTHEGDRQDARVYGKYAAQKVHHKFTEGA